MVGWEALDALSHQLELCRVDAGTRLVVVIDPGVDADLVALLRVALARSSAIAMEVRISPEQCAGNAPLAAAMAASDLVITTGAHQSTNVAGSQVVHLHAISPDRFRPHASLRRRVNALVDLVGSATTLSTTDANGTHLTLDLVGGGVRFDHGLLADDHDRACFPAGWVKVVPAAATVRGQLVLMPGDANLAASRLISSPVVLQIVGDHVAAIEGDSPDADVVRALLEGPAETSAYGIAGFNIGLNAGGAERPTFDDRLLDPVISQLLAGVLQISFGDNLIADRPCTQTITMALPGRTLHIDDLPIIANGNLQGDIAPDVYEL